MIDPLFTGSLVAASVALPLIASRVKSVRWLIKAPLSFVLANLIPFFAVELLDPDFRYGSMIGVAILMHIVISGILIFVIAAIFSARTLA